MIRLDSIAIQNYRGISDLKFDLSTDPNGSVHPIIGLNESGKTTVLEAFTFVSATHEDLSPLGITGLRRPANIDLIPISQRSNFTGTISVDLFLALDDKEADAIKAEFVKKTGYTIKHFPTKFPLHREVRFVDSEEAEQKSYYGLHMAYEKLRKRQPKPDREELWPIIRECVKARLPSILYVPNVLFDIPHAIELRTGPDLAPNQAFFQRLLDGVLKAHDPELSFDRHIIARSGDAKPSSQQALRATVTQLEYSLQKHVLSNWQKVFGRSLGDLAIRVAVAPVNEIPSLMIAIQQQGSDYRISDRSLGFRWFFAFLLLTFYRKSLGPDRQSVFLLDEPASNLHAGAQVRLLQCFRELDNALFLYSTHSHYLLSPELLPLTFVAINKGYDQTQDELYVATKTDIVMKPFRQFVSDHPDQTEHFRVALDALDVPVASLELCYPCVFVEGKSDWYYCRLAQLTGAFDQGIALYPCGGVNTMDLRVQEALASGKEFALLVDGDVAGDGIIAKLLGRYGAALDRRIMSLKNLPCPVQSGEDLFASEERTQAIAAAGLKGKAKKAFQRASELLVASGTRIELSEATKGKFESLASSLRGKMS